ncbi:MAG: TrmH family RNA methyltransferase [Flavobacteriales bacterium]|nr:TrmH family RNA methyltransferase [Flavobacteriales bacterium]
MRQLRPEELGRLKPEEVQHSPKLPLVVVLENIRSAFNVGSFFRTADALALEKLYLVGFTPCPPHADIRKAALGAENYVAWEHCPSLKELIIALPPHYLRVALELTDCSIPLEQFCPPRDRGVILFVGNEVHGLSQEALDLCSLALEIVQHGAKHSLNVAVAGGIAMWRITQLLKTK